MRDLEGAAEAKRGGQAALQALRGDASGGCVVGVAGAHSAQASSSLVTWSTVKPNCRASAAIVAAETSTYLPQRRPVGVERHRRRKAVAGATTDPPKAHWHLKQVWHLAEEQLAVPDDPERQLRLVIVLLPSGVARLDRPADVAGAHGVAVGVHSLAGQRDDRKQRGQPLDVAVAPSTRPVAEHEQGGDHRQLRTHGWERRAQGTRGVARGTAEASAREARTLSINSNS